MRNSIVNYLDSKNECIEFFIEAVHDSELKYCCKDLYRAGIESDAEIGWVIRRGIQSLNQAGWNPLHHFKHVFSTHIETGETIHDWKMSKLGFLLALMSAPESNPVIDKIKIELINQIK